MAFPAAPTESGSAKLHFLTTDGNAAAGWFGVTEGPTGTGANTVGFAAIATHVEGDAVAAPGGLNTTATDVPVVLVAGDDGTNAVPLQLSGSDLKITLDSEAVVLGAGTAEIGKLAAGVAEVGNVKNSGTFVVQVDGAALTALQLIDNPVAVLGTATYTETSTSGMIAGAVRNDALAALAGTDNEIAPLQVNASGALYTVLSAGTAEIGKLAAGTAAIGKLAANSGVDIGDVDVTSLVPGVAATSLGKAEDAAHSSGDTGVQMLAVRKATPADLSGADGDYEPLQLDNGRLWTSTTIDAALPAGTNAIGKLAANSGVDIGDVTLTAGTNAIGKLAANSGVDIGDVDVTSIVPGTAATNLGKVEDAAHSSGDVGVMSLAVRNDALAALAGADGDYAPLQVDEDGGLWTHPAAGPAGGCKGFFSNDLDQTEEDIATAACTVYGIYAWNATAAPLWLQIFNTNTVTVGTTAPTFNFIIPGNADSDGAGVVIPIPVQGLAFSTALTMAITTGVGTNNGAPGVNDAGVFVTYQD